MKTTIFALCSVAAIACSECVILNAAEKITEGKLKPIGGRWFTADGDWRGVGYRDADRTYDPFKPNYGDFNDDGIEDTWVSHDNNFLIIESQNFPNHPTAKFPNASNPNSIKLQNFKFNLPLKPKKSAKITTLPMGPIGVALNGVVFFNPFELGGMNAVEGYSEVWLDACCGHPNQQGAYHYHKYPVCVKSPFPDDGKGHSPIIGFAFDGFPIHGPYESAGVMAKDLKGRNALDVCNGHEDGKRGYHYHVTPGQFPYIIGGYHGVPEASNNRALRRGGTGPIKDNTEGKSQRIGIGISSVTPGTLSRGKIHTLTFVLNANVTEGRRRLSFPAGAPIWAQVGPHIGSNIKRVGNLVTADFKIPHDSNAGVLMDGHIEWEAAAGSRRGNTVLKKNNALRIID